MDRFDVGIVGAGIAGLSLAWHLVRQGRKVVVLERSAAAEGASVRNFGMVWVVGQPQGELHALALRSRELWLQAADQLGFWIRECGSLTLAYEEEELQVLREFLDQSKAGFDRRLLSDTEVLDRFGFVRKAKLLGGMWSPTEACVDPREVIHRAATTLIQMGVEIVFDANVTQIATGKINTSDGHEYRAEKIVVCPGPSLYSLFPEECEEDGLRPTKLQMMRLRPKDAGTPRLGVHLCAGLTLGHYRNFQLCPSLPSVLDMHRRKWPLQVSKGIHVLVSEHSDGTLTVGDSHEYGRTAPPYRDAATDDAILAALDEFLPTDRYEVTQRWEGAYNTHSTMPYWRRKLRTNVWGLNLFGTGMTLSFGVTERMTQELFT